MLLRLMLLLFIVSPTFAQAPENLIQNIHGRQTMVLDGQWGIVIDPYPTRPRGNRYDSGMGSVGWSAGREPDRHDRHP